MEQAVIPLFRLLIGFLVGFVLAVYFIDWLEYSDAD